MMITTNQLYNTLSEILAEVKEITGVPSLGQTMSVSQWYDEYGSILHGADFDFAARHCAETVLEECGANQDSKFTVNWGGQFLSVYKAEFPDEYICQNLKNALLEALSENGIGFDYDELFDCTILRKSEFHELLEDVHSFVEPRDCPWYGAEKFYDELSGIDIQKTAVACLCGENDFYDTTYYFAVVGNTVIVTIKYFSSDMKISWD